MASRRKLWVGGLIGAAVIVAVVGVSIALLSSHSPHVGHKSLTRHSVAHASASHVDVLTDSHVSAEEFATAFVAAFCRPTLTNSQWVSGIQPFFTPGVDMSQYAQTDPANVPCTRIVSATAVGDYQNQYAAAWQVQTDGQPIIVTMSRPTTDLAWRVVNVSDPDS